MPSGGTFGSSSNAAYLHVNASASAPSRPNAARQRATPTKHHGQTMSDQITTSTIANLLSSRCRPYDSSPARSAIRLTSADPEEYEKTDGEGGLDGPGPSARVVARRASQATGPAQR